MEGEILRTLVFIVIGLVIDFFVDQLWNYLLKISPADMTSVNPAIVLLFSHVIPLAASMTLSGAIVVAVERRLNSAT